MVKSNKSKSARKSTSMDRRSRFGAVSAITTAPVAIGNSMRGSKAEVVSRSGDSVRVMGRDYAFTPAATGTFDGWANVGGFPLTPACFVSSTLRAYTQIYSKFKFNNLMVHYITSSSTASTGDVMFSIVKNRSDPPADPKSATFLNYALSDPNTILGPQWTNHTAVVKPTGPIRTLDLGVNSDIDYQSQGELFLFSKTSTADSPGYVIFDYDITFHELSVNPRAGLLPNPDLIYTPCNLSTATASSTAMFTTPTTGTWANYTSSQSPTNILATSNYRAGNIYKCILCNIAGATFGSASVSTLLSTYIGGNATSAVTLTEAMVLYAVARVTGGLTIYPTIASAFASASNAAGMIIGTNPATATSIGCLLSYIGNEDPANLKQQ